MRGGDSEHQQNRVNIGVVRFEMSGAGHNRSFSCDASWRAVGSRVTARAELLEERGELRVLSEVEDAGTALQTPRRGCICRGWGPGVGATCQRGAPLERAGASALLHVLPRRQVLRAALHARTGGRGGHGRTGTAEHHFLCRRSAPHVALRLRGWRIWQLRSTSST